MDTCSQAYRQARVEVCWARKTAHLHYDCHPLTITSVQLRSPDLFRTSTRTYLCSAVRSTKPYKTLPTTLLQPGATELIPNLMAGRFLQFCMPSHMITPYRQAIEAIGHDPFHVAMSHDLVIPRLSSCSVQLYCTGPAGPDQCAVTTRGTEEYQSPNLYHDEVCFAPLNPAGIVCPLDRKSSLSTNSCETSLVAYPHKRTHFSLSLLLGSVAKVRLDTT